MKSKRNEWFYNKMCNLVINYLDFRHEIECLGAENIPEEGSALLLPKHDKFVDIAFEAYFLKKYCNRKGNWVMRYDLPGILNCLGGIPVVRTMDLFKIKKRSREKAAELISQGRQNNKKTDEYVKWLYNNGEIVVVHPEGTRFPGKVGPLKRRFFSLTKEFEEEYNKKIPIVPIGLEYRDKFILRAGKPLDINTPNIETIIWQEIKKLSNL